MMRIVPLIATLVQQLGTPPGHVAKPLAALYRAMTERVQQIVFSSPDEPEAD